MIYFIKVLLKFCLLTLIRILIKNYIFKLETGQIFYFGASILRHTYYYKGLKVNKFYISVIIYLSQLSFRSFNNNLLLGSSKDLFDDVSLLREMLLFLNNCLKIGRQTFPERGLFQGIQNNYDKLRDNQEMKDGWMEKNSDSIKQN
ncbi:unnamed protein product [Paramecium octaurelia]|uniref:Uncharacterized protein n=1 Tax=Paramecium octaurelia TaxID=43137 RepID=A0A8S1W7V9_PAROT|nr:unnamed protein product [Paramecium octaurelia]